MEKALNDSSRQDLYAAASSEDDALASNADQSEPGRHNDTGNNVDNDDGNDNAVAMDDASASPPEWRSDLETKVTGFTLLLLEEFLATSQLPKTAQMLKDELSEWERRDVPRSVDLWCEMYHDCRAVLAHCRATSSSSSNRNSSTLERLIAFCVSPSNPLNRKGGRFALNLRDAPVTVCASPKKMGSLAKNSGMQLAATASIPAFSLMDAHMQMMRSPVVRPSRRTGNGGSHGASLSVSVSAPALALVEPSLGFPKEPESTTPKQPAPITSKKVKKKRKHHENGVGDHHRHHHQHHSHHHHPESYYFLDKPHTNGHFGGSQANVSVYTGANFNYSHRTVTPSSYVEPALMLAHDAQLKHDLSSVRILERELRHIRLEKIAVEPKKALAKRLGYASMTKAETQAERDKRDPYLNDLVREKYGFSRRAECALCQFPFLQVNLPHKVSFKCVMDVYASWKYEPPGKNEGASKFKAPFCYDAVHVCRMCAQIVLQHTGAALGAANTDETPHSRKKGHPNPTKAAAHHSGSSADDSAFVSDPYALPPLFADDFYDPTSPGARGNGDDRLEEQRSGCLESPAKAIVYANQTTEASHFMSVKEWEVINPQRSLIREAIEGTLRRASLPVTAQINSVFTPNNAI
uniref:Uncharacterized protein n=1 Tax=Globisporangium ultimum (strain ATCC 200006 / CBS 805.95 / DAOM BR144) TaxID=431595 RepID=K3X3U0_GLOUD